ncbi:MAG: hypothetical protein AAF927_33015 [Bacteroidota bacterium]
MRLFLPLLIAIFIAAGCKSQQQVNGGGFAQPKEIDETADWRGNPETEFYVNLTMFGPLFPEGKTFYLYLQPKEGIFQEGGRNYLFIQDEVSPYPTTFRLQVPRLDRKSQLINPDANNINSTYSLVWREKSYESALIGGEVLYTLITPDNRVVNGEFNSVVMLDGQEHQLSGVFMVESFLRRR